MNVAEKFARTVGGVCIAAACAYEFAAITGIRPWPTISRHCAENRHRLEVKALIVGLLALLGWHLLWDEG